MKLMQIFKNLKIGKEPAAEEPFEGFYKFETHYGNMLSEEPNTYAVVVDYEGTAYVPWERVKSIRTLDKIVMHEPWYVKISDEKAVCIPHGPCFPEEDLGALKADPRKIDEGLSLLFGNRITVVELVEALDKYIDLGETPWATNVRLEKDSGILSKALVNVSRSGLGLPLRGDEKPEGHRDYKFETFADYQIDRINNGGVIKKFVPEVTFND